MNYKIRLMLRVLSHAGLMLMVAALSGCSWLFGDEGHFRERTMDYQQAKEASPLRFPQGIPAKSLVELYPIPEVKKQQGFLPLTGEDIPRPRSILSVNDDLGIELRTDGSLTWLIVEQGHEKLWTTLTEFLIASGMDVKYQDKLSGKIETNWLKPRVIEEEGVWTSLVKVFNGDRVENTREKFLLTVSQVGSQQKYRINIDHVTRVRTEQGLPDVSQEDWEDDEEDRDLLDTLYAELSDYVADEKNRRNRASVMAHDLTAMPSYLMTQDGNGYPVLMMQMDLNRAWIEVGAAIKKAKLTQNDLNLSLGIYYISTGIEGEDSHIVYEVKLISAENGVQVAVQIDDDTVAPIDVSEELLTAISKQLG